MGSEEVRWHHQAKPTKKIGLQLNVFAVTLGVSGRVRRGSVNTSNLRDSRSYGVEGEMLKQLTGPGTSNKSDWSRPFFKVKWPGT